MGIAFYRMGGIIDFFLSFSYKNIVGLPLLSIVHIDPLVFPFGEKRPLHSFGHALLGGGWGDRTCRQLKDVL
jgi:hypothetical protein